MKLYKVIRLVGDHGVSVFPPDDKELPESDELAGDPWADNFRRLRLLGFTDYQAGHALKAWAYHAKYELHQGAAGIRRFVEQCVAETARQQVPPQPIVWGLVALVALIVAVALGLYVWVYLDKKLGVTFGAHKWAYVMTYQESLWQAEVLFVSAGQEGVYEKCGDLGPVLDEHRRNAAYIDRKLDRVWFNRRLRLAGRRLLFFHEYRWIYWDVYFCGVLTHLSSRRYRLREGNYDPYKPRGRWLRPGGNFGAPDYEGCWGPWWWL